MKIDYHEISVVVQGAIDKEWTSVCLESIRNVLPGATIILSTWKDSNVEGLDYDVLIENNDPGGQEVDSTWKVWLNDNRQIESSKNGLKAVKTRYAMKIRSDIALENSNFLNYFGKFDEHRGDELRILENRIIINNLYCANPYLTNYPLHWGDWVQFGLTTDLQNIWDIPLHSLSMNSYFLGKPRALLHKSELR